MKKFKKVLSAVSAAVLCALPMVNVVASNAASDTEKYNTYVLYHDVKKPSVAYFEFTINYDSSVIAEPSMKTALCGTNYFNSIHYTTSRKIQTTYSGSAFGQTGTAATTKLLAPVSTESIFDLISYGNVTVKNANGASMSQMSINTYDVLIGDANGDGYVNMADATAIIQSIGNRDKYGLSEYGYIAADVNFDGMVTGTDALLIQDYLADVINHF